MKLIKRALGLVVGAIIIIGVILGLLRWQESDPDGGVIAALSSVVGAIADITYRGFPKLVELVKRLFESL